MPVHSTAQKERKSGPAVKAGGKVMGKRDRRAEACNWENVEEFIDLLKNRVIVTGLTVARCTRALGAGRCEVQLMNGEVYNLPIAGSIKVKNARKTHVQACMTAGDVVLINGGQITATLSVGHKARAERAFRAIQEHGCYAGGSAAGGVKIPSEFANRIDTEARIAFPPSFFGASESAEDEEGWEFDRSDEEAESGVARTRLGVIAEEAEAEVEINMDDL